MEAKIYLALYRGRRDGTGIKVWVARFSDWLTRVLTRGRYSHCEIAVRNDDSDTYTCYSSSVRDGGVRCKTMPLPSDKWDLIELPSTVHDRLQQVWQTTKGKPYDWPGALGVVFKTRNRDDKWFCSELCASVIGLPESWRFSPNDLAAICKGVRP